MKNVLEEVSQTSIKLADFQFTEEQIRANWLGNEPASDGEIIATEKRLNINFPDDYREFLKHCNGFHAASDIEPTFISVDKVDYLQNLDPDLITIWTETGNIDVGQALRKSIVIGGLAEEQYFLIIPSDKNSKWRYWKFASWIPGEHEYAGLREYWNDVLEFNRAQLETK